MTIDTAAPHQAKWRSPRLRYLIGDPENAILEELRQSCNVHELNRVFLLALRIGAKAVLNKKARSVFHNMDTTAEEQPTALLATVATHFPNKPIRNPPDPSTRIEPPDGGPMTPSLSPKSDQALKPNPSRSQMFKHIPSSS